VAKLPDNEIMCSVRDGDLKQMGILFDKYHKRLFNFFLRQTRDQQTSEDLVQDVFYRMLKYRQSYRGDSAFTTWMFSVARSAFYTHYRKKKLKTDSYKSVEDLKSTDQSPADTVEKDHQTELIHKALARLPRKKREVLLLSRFENMKYKDIAKVMGCKLGTIKARVHSALQDLAVIYEDISGEVLK
jgi:RNA polymerase sigma factor (sigma-70 family)